MFDAVVASLAYLLVLPVLAVVLGKPLVLLVYLVDVPATLVPVLVAARRRGEVRRAVASLPAFLRAAHGQRLLHARGALDRVVLRRPLLVYEKRH